MTEGALEPDHIRDARLGKLRALEDAGVRAFPTSYERTHLASELVANFEQLEGQPVRDADQHNEKRNKGKKANDKHTDDTGPIQLLIHPEDLPSDSRLVYDNVDPGDFVGASGVLTKTRRGEVSVE